MEQVPSASQEAAIARWNMRTPRTAAEEILIRLVAADNAVAPPGPASTSIEDGIHDPLQAAWIAARAHVRSLP